MGRGNMGMGGGERLNNLSKVKGVGKCGRATVLGQLAHPNQEFRTSQKCAWCNASLSVVQLG
jgi:hypothetical protein